MSKKDFVTSLFSKRANYNDPEQAELVANLLDTVSSDIYSESQRFVFELIQNADDAASGDANEVRFDFFDQHLLVSHNGSPFTPQDIEAITGAGSSPKKNDPTKTGYKGIGFKAVFGKSEWVGIFSDGYQLRFEKAFHATRLPWQVIPIWTATDILPEQIRQFIESGAYRVTTVIRLAAVDALAQELAEVLQNGQILLFLRHVNAITVARQGQVQYAISKTVAPATAAYQPTTLWKDRQATSIWLVQRFDQLPVDSATQEALKADGEKTPVKLRDATHTELAFAARVENGRIRPLTAEESLLFTYLPTKVSGFGFPFLVNGSFLTTAPREALHEDRVWNQWLLGLVAGRLFAWLAQLAQTDHRFEVLQLLPTLFPGSGNGLKKAFTEKARQALATCAFVPTQSGTLALVSETILDDTGLANQACISQKALVEFINAKTGRNFSAASFAHTDLQHTRQLLKLGATLFEANNLEAFFLSETFANSHEVEANYGLLEYFFRKATKFDTTGEWSHKLKHIPFLYSAEQELKAPATICFPSIAYKTEAGQTVTVIHPTVFEKLSEKADLKSWLESLGVKEPSDVAYLENELLGNIKTCITRENYLEVTRYLFGLFKKGKLTAVHLAKLHDLRLVCTNNVRVIAKDCYLADAYEPVLSLESVTGLSNYVSPAYRLPQDLISEWKSFFLKIGVSENISLVSVACNKSDHRSPIEDVYFDLVIKEGKASNGYPNWIDERNSVHLDKITASHCTHKYDFSKLFWRQVFLTVNLNQVQPYARIPWGMYGSSQSVKNYFHWFLDNRSAFPTSQKTCRKAAEIFINRKDIVEVAGAYLPVFDYDELIPEAWKPLLKFRQKLEVADYLKILTGIAQTAGERNGAVSDAERKRIGLVYNQLAERLAEFSTNDKLALSIWSGANRLLASNDSFELATSLKWITQEGFQVPSGGNLKALYIPKNCQSDKPEFAQLLGLMQVQCVRDFTPEIADCTPNSLLQKKLLQILPYLALVIQKRHYKSADVEFSRMHMLVKATTFFAASSIRLTFTNQGETIHGQPLPVFRGPNNSFYLKGDWRNPLTAYHLRSELGALLEVKGVDNELSLLLELPSFELVQWLLEHIGVAPADLAAAQSWLNIAELAEPTVMPDNGQSVAPQPEARAEANGFDEASVAFEWPESTFNPTVLAEDIDPTTVRISQYQLVEQPAAAQQVSYGANTNPKARLDVGRWCEGMVYTMLRANPTDFTEVQWINEHGESGLPYDFKVVQKGQARVLEVKGTQSGLKNTIYMSTAEWREMFEQGPNYSIYRVLGAGEPGYNIVVVDNPRSLIEQGGLLPTTIELAI